MPKFANADVLCLYGTKGISSKSLFHWLKENTSRRLVLIEEEESDQMTTLKDHPRVHACFLETPLAIKGLAKKIAWRAAFQELSFFAASPSPYIPIFQQVLYETHTAAHLLLSDAADFGTTLFSHVLKNRSPAKNGLALKGTFQGLPAVVSGAGPSLKKNGPLLATAKKESLLFAGGHATALLHKIGIEPHLTAAIDPICPLQDFEEQLFWETPFLFQKRINPLNFAKTHSTRIAFPDGHFQFEAYLSGFDELFPGGWTVGTFLLKLASWMGCNPIIWVGMDLMKKKDFWMAARWIEELACSQPDRTFINATEGGAKLAFPVRTMSLKKALHLYGHPYDYEGALHQVLLDLPETASIEPRLRKWKKSLKDGGKLAHLLLFEPLWSLWRPIFEREAESDGFPIPLEEKLQVHKTLFQKNILQEYAAKNLL